MDFNEQILVVNPRETIATFGRVTVTHLQRYVTARLTEANAEVALQRGHVCAR